MSQALHLAQLRVLQSQQRLSTAAQMFLHFTLVVTKWDMKRRTRKALGALDACQLHDIGVARPPLPKPCPASKSAPHRSNPYSPLACA